MAGGKIYLSAKPAMKRTYRRTYGSKPSSSALNRKIKKIVGAEVKQFDLQITNTPIPTIDGVLVSFSIIPTGDDFDEKNGNWVQPVSLRGVFTVVGNVDAIAAQRTSRYRVAILCWKEDLTVNAPDLAKIMQDTAQPHQGYRIQGKGTFSILWSRVGILSNEETNPNFQKMHRFSVYPKMKALFDGNQRTKYHLFALAYSDVAAASDPPQIFLSTRLRYTDS